MRLRFNNAINFGKTFCSVAISPTWQLINYYTHKEWVREREWDRVRERECHENNAAKFCSLFSRHFRHGVPPPPPSTSSPFSKILVNFFANNSPTKLGPATFSYIKRLFCKIIQQKYCMRLCRTSFEGLDRAGISPNRPITTPRHQKANIIE